MRCASIGDAPPGVANHKLSEAIQEFLGFYGVTHLVTDLLTEWDQTVAMGAVMQGISFTAIAGLVNDDNRALWDMAAARQTIIPYRERYPAMLQGADLALVSHRQTAGPGHVFDKFAQQLGVPVVNLWGAMVRPA